MLVRVRVTLARMLHAIKIVVRTSNLATIAPYSMEMDPLQFKKQRSYY